MSLTVFVAASLVDGGKTEYNISINVVWKLLIGIYGIRVNKNIIAGKNARKKLNAIDEALVVIDPSMSPVQKKEATS